MSRATPSRLECALVRDPGAIEALVPGWEALLARSRCDPAFACPDWTLAALTSTGRDPRLVIARREGRLVGVLPLSTDADETTWCPAGILADYHHAVVEAGDVAAAEALLLEVAARCTQLRIERLRPESELVQAWRALESRGRAPGRIEAGAEHRLVRPEPTDEAFLAGRSRSFRRGLRRARSRAAAAGLRIDEATPATLPADALVEHFERLHFARHGDDSAFARPEHARFLRTVLPLLYARGRARPLLLRQLDRVVAIELCLQGHDRLCAWNTGFLPEVASFAPGRLLMDAAVALVRAEGLSGYDLLRGAWSYKRSWTDHCVATVTLTLGSSEASPRR